MVLTRIIASELWYQQFIGSDVSCFKEHDSERCQLLVRDCTSECPWFKMFSKARQAASSDWCTSV